VNIAYSSPTVPLLTNERGAREVFMKILDKSNQIARNHEDEREVISAVSAMQTQL
jgi:hypothetical protein